MAQRRAGAPGPYPHALTLSRTFTLQYPPSNDVQALLSTWCCTALPAFKRTAGLVPYFVPPHPAQSSYGGNPWMRWAAVEMANAFANAGDHTYAALLNATIRDGGPKYAKGW